MKTAEADDVPIVNPFAHYTRWLAIVSAFFFVTGAVCAGIGAATGSQLLVAMGLIGGGVLAVSCGLVALLCWSLAKRLGERISQVEQSPLLANWTIPKEEWNSFIRDQRVTERAKSLPAHWILLGLGVGIGVAVGIGTSDWRWFAIGTAVGVVLFPIALVIRESVVASKYPAAAGDTAIVIQAGRLSLGAKTFLWNRLNTHLDRVEVNAVGQLVFTYSGEVDHTPYVSDVVVPVPPNRVAEAHQVAAKYNSRSN